MKRIFFWLILVVLCGFFLFGCAESPWDNTDDSVPPLETDPPDVDKPNPGVDPPPEEEIPMEYEQVEEMFLSWKKLYSIYDGWLYYATWIGDRDYDTWKCRLDLTEDQRASEALDISHPISAQGYARMQERNKWFFYNVKDGTRKEVQISVSSYNFMIYKNFVILVNLDNASRLELYDLKGNLHAIISEGTIESHGIINDSVYYFEYYHEYHLDRIGNTIFRYDMKTKEREVYFTFEPNDSFEPRVHFDQNRIIVQTDVNVFVYATTKDRVPKTIELPPRHFYSYIYNEDGYLYFNYGQLPEDAEDEYTPPAYYVHYRVESGSTEPVFYNKFDGWVQFIIDGYVYFIREDEPTDGFMREKFDPTSIDFDPTSTNEE